MILVVAEVKDGKLSKSTRENIQAARACGAATPVGVLVLGDNIDAAAQEAAKFADVVLTVQSSDVARFDAELWAAAVAQVAQSEGAEAVFVGASRSGREYSPRVAVKLDAALLEDVFSLRFAEKTWMAERYTFLNRVTESIAAATAQVVVSIKPGAFAEAQPATQPGEVRAAVVQLPARRLQGTAEAHARSTRVPLAEASIVVAGGRGVGSAEGFTQTVEALADALGGAVGATRAIVDAGWRPYDEQVGQTGKTVQPKLYIAIGISGAVQHLSGMNKSGTIVAINKDKDAPIFKAADFAIAGDVAQIVPAVLAELGR